MPPLKDLTGQRFGRLIVLSKRKENKGVQPQWECLCDCGNVCIVTSNHLLMNRTQSCGCLQKERAKQTNTKHGGRYHSLYSTWLDIKKRCYNPNSHDYHNYGGRGIQMCEEWRNNFDIFEEWCLSHGYAKGLSIDRINNNGNYEPSNCRWVSNKTQCNNKRTNFIITYNNETHTLMEWSEITGIKWGTIRKRIVEYHWSIEKALTTPVQTIPKPILEGDF